MPFNTATANQLLNWTLGNSALSLDAKNNVYIGLSTNDPEADGGTFNEFEGDTYERILISKKDSPVPDVIGTASDRSIENKKQINWT